MSIFKFDDGLFLKKIKKFEIPKSLKVQQDTYVIYYKPSCIFSMKAMELVKNKNVKHENINFFELSTKEKKNVLNKTKKYNKNKEYLLYPKIFKNNIFIGGFSELQQIL